MNLRFSLLSEDDGKADRQNFSCGTPELDAYLHRQANQDVARGFSTVVLARAMEEPATILGYYAFSAASVPIVSLPMEISKKMPRYRNVPAILLGRLAVALPVQGQRIGSLLLFDALRRACAGEIAWAILRFISKYRRMPSSLAWFLRAAGYIQYHQ